MQPRFLVRSKGKGVFGSFDRIYQADRLDVNHPEIKKVKDPGAFIQHLEGTGKYNPKKVELQVWKAQQEETGTQDRHQARVVFPLTADALKKHVVRLRPQEAEALDEMDDHIEEMRRNLKRLQEARSLLLRKAFQNGHVVTLKEVKQNIGFSLDERE